MGIAEEIAQHLLDAIIETIINEGRIELRNFGVFEVKTRQGIYVEPTKIIKFTPAKHLAERVHTEGRLPNVTTKKEHAP